MVCVVFCGWQSSNGEGGSISLLVRWRTRPVSERWLLQEVCDFLSFHGRPSRNRKPLTRGERVWGQDIFPMLELCPPHQKRLPHLVEPLEPPPCSTLRGPVSTRVVRMPSPQILS
jgi:hypothetical protein